METAPAANCPMKELLSPLTLRKAEKDRLAAQVSGF